MKNKTYTIKKLNGEKVLIVNDLEKADVKSLFRKARELKFSFAVKKETGVQFWGLFTVCDYLGINDCSTFFD